MCFIKIWFIYDLRTGWHPENAWHIFLQFTIKSGHVIYKNGSILTVDLTFQFLIWRGKNYAITQIVSSKKYYIHFWNFTSCKESSLFLYLFNKTLFEMYIFYTCTIEFKGGGLLSREFHGRFPRDYEPSSNPLISFFLPVGISILQIYSYVKFRGI